MDARRRVLRFLFRTTLRSSLSIASFAIALAGIWKYLVCANLTVLPQRSVGNMAEIEEMRAQLTPMKMKKLKQQALLKGVPPEAV
eukprot:SAG11_NODE_19401_length_467_cov_1.130435_1_plen_84_part_10